MTLYQPFGTTAEPSEKMQLEFGGSWGHWERGYEDGPFEGSVHTAEVFQDVTGSIVADKI